jgi:hypothetical protein
MPADAGRRRRVEPGQDRPSEPPFDSRALRVHGDVDDAAEEPRGDQGDGDFSLGRGVEQTAQGRAVHDRADRQDAFDAEALRERAARRHGDEIGAGVDGEQDAERRGVNAGAGQDRAGGAAP